MWSGLRPLAASGNASTAKLSRDHRVTVSHTGLITVTGGKWTTYRRMGEDAIDHAADVARLKASPSRTLELPLHGSARAIPGPSTDSSKDVYGSDLPALETLCNERSDLAERLHPQLPYRKGEVLWAARFEMARTVEDVLARRTRSLFLNARAAIEAAPLVATMLAEELGRSPEFRDRDLLAFETVARGYIYEA